MNGKREKETDLKRIWVRNKVQYVINGGGGTVNNRERISENVRMTNVGDIRYKKDIKNSEKILAEEFQVRNIQYNTENFSAKFFKIVLVNLL